jgi:hypothetical protein
MREVTILCVTEIQVHEDVCMQQQQKMDEIVVERYSLACAEQRRGEIEMITALAVLVAE